MHGIYAYEKTHKREDKQKRRKCFLHSSVQLGKRSSNGRSAREIERKRGAVARAENSWEKRCCFANKSKTETRRVHQRRRAPGYLPYDHCRIRVRATFGCTVMMVVVMVMVMLMIPDDDGSHFGRPRLLWLLSEDAVNYVDGRRLQDRRHGTPVPGTVTCTPLLDKHATLPSSYFTSPQHNTTLATSTQYLMSSSSSSSPSHKYGR